MEHSERPELPEGGPDIQPDRLDYLEARVRMLEERMPDTRLLDRRFLPRAFAVLGHYLVAGLIIYLVALVAILSLAAIGAGIARIPGLAGSVSGLPTLVPGLPSDAAVKAGPRLGSVASLPVDPSGEGTIQGAPTGEATNDDNGGSFVLVLDPAPAGLPARTTLDVAFDHSTKVYSGGRQLDDPVTAMDADPGPDTADPSAARTVVVRFHIKNGEVFADRLDLSD
jgi:hypothetical protein